ncbi:MAG: hypothetical protein KGI98_14540 [Euryarchaeota archaeon]|nr:hypothetical protein [Euryarchaeota archaeon]MDE1881163.1 hypothetical protein [Euryarchaeota archaeon]
MTEHGDGPVEDLHEVATERRDGFRCLLCGFEGHELDVAVHILELHPGELTMLRHCGEEIPTVLASEHERVTIDRDRFKDLAFELDTVLRSCPYLSAVEDAEYRDWLSETWAPWSSRASEDLRKARRARA